MEEEVVGDGERGTCGLCGWRGCGRSKIQTPNKKSPLKLKGKERREPKGGSERFTRVRVVRKREAHMAWNGKVLHFFFFQESRRDDSFILLAHLRKHINKHTIFFSLRKLFII